MTRAIYPGSFDPITLGHLDIVERASRLFDELVLAVGDNPAKRPLFPAEDRVAMAREATRRLGNVRVERFSGLLIDFVRSLAPAVVVRGLRSAADFDAEARMAFTNRLAGGVETVFLPAAPAYAFHTARLIREIALGGGDVSAFVPKAVARRLSRRAAEAEGRR